MEENFKSSMREFISMPFSLSKKMLKNSEILFRISKPEDFTAATGQAIAETFCNFFEQESTPMFGSVSRKNREDVDHIDSVKKSLFDSIMSD
jgi:hypothetical protein